MSFGAVFSSILAMIITLAFVLGLAWGVIWLMKKVQDRQSGGLGDSPNDRPIRFLRSLPLGQRERVALIEVRGETMLIGVSAGAVTLLARWEGREEDIADIITTAETPKPKRAFSLPDFPVLPKRTT